MSSPQVHQTKLSLLIRFEVVVRKLFHLLAHTHVDMN